MEDKRIELLKNAPVSKAVNHMCLPAIIGLLVMAVYNIVDTMFVAWLGTAATGATQVVFPITMVISSFGLAFGIGGGSYVSRLLGRSDKEKANEVTTVSVFTTIAIGLLFTVISIVFMEALLGFFGALDDVMVMAKSYGLYILLGTIFTMGNMALNNLLRAEGSSKLSMIGMGIGAILNIILDPILIFVFDMGIAGAAIATSFSQLVTFIILISRYLGNHSVTKISTKYFKPTLHIYGETLKVGIPTFIRQILFSVSLAVLNQGAVNYGGSDLLAAVGLVFKISMMPMYVIFGIGQGFQPVVGYNFGAKNKSRVMGSLKYTLFLCIVISVVSSILLLIFDIQILSIFKATDSVVKYGIEGIKYYALAIVLMAVTNTIGVFYQSLGKGRESLLLAITRQGLFFIPVILILPQFMGEAGILSAQLIADFLTLALSMIMFIPYIKKNKIVSDFI